MLDLDNPFWLFSGAIYAMPGVADACLALQDEAGADVNMLLLAAWVGAALGCTMTPADFAAAPGTAWHRETILPIRTVRRRSKPAAAQAADPALEAFYRQLLACELAAERIRQAMLHEWASRRFAARGFAEGAALANMATLADIDAHRQAATTVAQHAEAYYRDRA